MIMMQVPVSGLNDEIFHKFGGIITIATAAMQHDPIWLRLQLQVSWCPRRLKIHDVPDVSKSAELL